MANDDITIALLDESTIGLQVEIYRSAFAPTATKDEIMVVWRKKHYENPLGNSLIFGAFEVGRLVGINAYMPVEYHYDGKAVKMLQSCESGVLPTCQGKGIWRKIVTYALDYISKNTNFVLVIGFPNYVNSYPGFKKMGWKTVCDMKNYVMINNLSAFQNVFLNKNYIYRLLVKGVVLQRILLNIYNNKKYIVEKTHVEDLIWPDVEANVISCSHTVDLVKWKKDYKKLITITVKIKNEKVATCLYGLSTYAGSTIIVINSFGLAAGYRKKEKYIFARLLKYFAREHPDVSFVRVWTQEKTTMSSLLKSLLFLSSSHQNPFIVSDPENVYANKSWSLSFFDLD